MLIKAGLFPPKSAYRSVYPIVGAEYREEISCNKEFVSDRLTAFNVYSLLNLKLFSFHKGMTIRWVAVIDCFTSFGGAVALKGFFVQPLPKV